MRNIPFEFKEPSTHCEPPDSFVLPISKGIQSKKNLFAGFASAGKFPEYFGGNWDAFFDCLRDFEWISEKKIIILHGDLPLSGNEADCRTYLELLQATTKDWTDSIGRSNLANAFTGFSSHELLVVFPEAVRRDISNLLLGHSRD